MKIIQICGNLCSGKTTLSKILTDNLNFKYIHADLDNSLIDSFFHDTGKYFLQQQLSFLLNKAMKIHSCIQNNESMVIDRSIFEDIYIFADYFIKNNKTFNINQSDIDVYKYIAKKIISNLPKTDIAIYCNTSTTICDERLHSRQCRSYEKLYPKNHIENLYNEYKQKIYSIDCNTLLELDGDKYDLYDSKTQNDILKEVKSLLDNEQNLDFKTKCFTLVKRSE